jgi:hypothetical protein
LDQLEDDGGGVVPLPEDHWINQPFEADGKTFLIFSIEDVPDVEFCRKLVKISQTYYKQLFWYESDFSQLLYSCCLS